MPSNEYCDKLSNVAYTVEYKNHLAQIDIYLFRPECFVNEIQEELEGITIVTHDFVCKNHPDYPYNLSGSKNNVIVNGRIIYSFRTYDGSGYFWKILHQNGGQYLVFRQELYGYSVLDIETKKEYQYFPKGSFPSGETFIWAILYYNPNNNILAVDGCYWACPASIVLADFTNPMEDTVYIDINEYNGDGYQDMEFSRWDGTNLVCKLRGKKSGTEVVIKESEYMSWLDKARKTW